MGATACQTVGHVSSKATVLSVSPFHPQKSQKPTLDLRPVGFASQTQSRSQVKLAVTQSAPDKRFPASPSVEKKYTLPELLVLAWQKSPRLREAKYQLESFRARKSEVIWSTWWPQGSVVAVVAPAPPARGDALRTTTPYPEAYNRTNQYGVLTRVEMSVALPLYTFGKLTLLQNAASHGIKLGEANILLEKSKWEVLVKQAYYGLQFAESSLALLEEAEEQINEAKKKVKSPTDKLKIEVIEAQVLSRRVQAETGRQLAQSGLARLAGLPLQQPVKLVESELVETTLNIHPLNTYQQLAEKHRPELQLLEHALRAKKALLDAQRRTWLPDLFLAGFFRWGYSSAADDQLSPFARDDFNFIEGGVLLGAKWNLDIPITIAKIRRTEAEFEMFRSQKMLATQGIQMQVEQRYRELVAAQRLVGIHKRGRKAANQWMTKSVLAFQSGLVEMKEVSDSLLAYAQTQFGFLEAMHNQHIAAAQLTRAVGTEITQVKTP